MNMCLQIYIFYNFSPKLCRTYGVQLTFLIGIMSIYMNESKHVCAGVHECVNVSQCYLYVKTAATNALEHVVNRDFFSFLWGLLIRFLVSSKKLFKYDPVGRGNHAVLLSALRT